MKALGWFFLPSGWLLMLAALAYLQAALRGVFLAAGLGLLLTGLAFLALGHKKQTH